MSERDFARTLVYGVVSANHEACTGNLETCPEPECLECGERACPHAEPLHFHHDGCPSCFFAEPEGAP